MAKIQKFKKSKLISIFTVLVTIMSVFLGLLYNETRTNFQNYKSDTAIQLEQNRITLHALESQKIALETEIQSEIESLKSSDSATSTRLVDLENQLAEIEIQIEHLQNTSGGGGLTFEPIDLTQNLMQINNMVKSRLDSHPNLKLKVKFRDSIILDDVLAIRFAKSEESDSFDFAGEIRVSESFNLDSKIYILEPMSESDYCGFSCGTDRLGYDFYIQLYPGYNRAPDFHGKSNLFHHSEFDEDYIFRIGYGCSTLSLEQFSSIELIY